MPYTVGRCTKADYCSIAASKRDVLVNAGENFSCPECGNPLTAVALGAGQQAKGGSGRVVAIAVAAIALVGAGVGAALFLRPGSSPAPAPAPAAQTPAPTPPPPAEASAAPAPAAPPPSGASEMRLLRIYGTNAFTLELLPRLATTFMANAGDSDITTAADARTRTDTISGMRGPTRESITITTSTTPVALKAMANGQADALVSTRRVSPAERETLMPILGDMTSPSADHVLLLDAIAVVVNPANKVGAVTARQLHDIYTGAITDWSQLGGAPGPIHPWDRLVGSGTRDQFHKFAIGNDPEIEIPPSRITDDDGPVVAGVGADRGAIAYVSQAHIGSARALAIAELGSEPVLPTAASISTEEYPLSRRIYLYTPAKPANSFVTKFVEYAESTAGQDLVGDSGFISQNVKQIQAPVAPAAAAGQPQDRYHQLIAGATRLSVDFRFKPASNSLDNLGLKDLDRVANLMAQKHYDDSRLMLIGFADNAGSPETNLAISKERVNAVAALFANRGIVPGVVEGFGAENPLADNSTPDGRERNRRVEVYLRPAP